MSTIGQYGTATWNTNAGNKAVTGGPGNINDFVVAICANSGRTTANAPTMSDNNPDGLGGSANWIQLRSQTKNASADSLWVFVRRYGITDVTSTTWTMTQASDTGGGLWVGGVSGMNRFGLGGVRQSAGQDNAAAGTPSVTLGSAVLTGNCVLGAVFTTSNSTTNTAPPTSWSESVDLGYNTPTSGLEVATRNSGETNTTIAWTAATASAFCSVVVEFDTTLASVPDVILQPRLVVRT